MYPVEALVDEGDRVNLQITSDRPVEFHLHGYDLTEAVSPGDPAELSFDATIAGSFPIEDHDAEAELGVPSCSRASKEAFPSCAGVSTTLVAAS